MRHITPTTSADIDIALTNAENSYIYTCIQYINYKLKMLNKRQLEQKMEQSMLWI